MTGKPMREATSAASIKSSMRPPLPGTTGTPARLHVRRTSSDTLDDEIPVIPFCHAPAGILERTKRGRDPVIGLRPFGAANGHSRLAKPKTTRHGNHETRKELSIVAIEAA